MDITDSILNAKDFIFAPFTPEVGGDSGVLTLATLKSDPQIRYVIKSGYSEIACNEFMYHHIAAALGLYTQEARLFKGITGSKYAVGIRYVPNARKFIHDEANEDNKRVFYEFKMLFVILNEEDSEEYFYDEQDRVFKLDNAASFNMDTEKTDYAIKYGKKVPPYWILNKIVKGLEYIEYEKYSIILRIINKHYGQTATETAFDFIKKFSEFDLAKITNACETLEKIYPLSITEYYPAFIERRIKFCKRFIAENSIEIFMK